MYVKNVEEKHLASIGKARVLCICVFRVSNQLDHKERILTTERHIQKHRSGPGVLPFEQHPCGGQPLRSPAGTWGDVPLLPTYTSTLICRRKGCHLVDTSSIAVSSSNLSPKSIGVRSWGDVFFLERSKNSSCSQIIGTGFIPNCC